MLCCYVASAYLYNIGEWSRSHFMILLVLLARPRRLKQSFITCRHYLSHPPGFSNSSDRGRFNLIHTFQ